MPATNFPDGVVIGGTATATVTGARSAAITDAVVAAAAPTKAEFDAVVAKLNLALAALRRLGAVTE